MKKPSDNKALMTVIGGICAVLVCYCSYIAFSVLPKVPVFISMGEMAARLTSGEFSSVGEEPSQTQPEPQKEQKPDIQRPSSWVSDSLISLSGVTYEFESEDEDAPLPEEELFPSHISGPIVRKTYTYEPSGSIIELPFGGLLRNCTDITNDYLLNQCERDTAQVITDLSKPTVLIMHTHTTEGYESQKSEFYNEYDSSRSTDLTKTVVAVGEKIAQKLEEAGVGVIHLTEMFDYPEYSGAYDRSCEKIIKILEENPSIQIVIDVHRDAIESEGVRYAPVTEIDGKTAAQVMIICGCMNVPQYRYNLRLASRLQGIMETNYPGLTRPILFDERNYNQELTKGSILLEMGSHANSLDEALYSGELVGECLKQLVLELINE